MSEYISVSEFASRAGVTCQAVYLRLNKDLKPYLKLDGKRKTVNVEGLKLYQKSSVEQDVEQPIAELLKSQLEAKDRQLEVKDHQLEEKDKQIAELLERLKESNYTLVRFGIEDKQEPKQEQPKTPPKAPATKKPIRRTPKGLKGLFKRK